MFATTWKKKGLSLVFHPLFHDCNSFSDFLVEFFIVLPGLQITIFQD
jgi:hypothetical protein